MAQSTKRRGPWLKLLMASGVLGGGGAGAYQYADLLIPSLSAAEEHAALDPTALDAAQSAWGEQWASNPTAKPNPFGSLPMPQPVDLPPAPTQLGKQQHASRYSATPLPFPLDESEVSDAKPITRGQNPSDEYDLTPTAPFNPLRSAPVRRDDQPAAAQHAFKEQDEEVGPPPASRAAFEGSGQQKRATPVQAIEPIADEPPEPLGMPPMIDDELPLAALPQANSMDEPKAMPEHSVLPPMPGDEPNPLRASPEENPLPIPPAVSQPSQGLPIAAFESQPAPPAALPNAMHRPVAMDQPRRFSAQENEFTDSQSLVPTTEGAGRPGERALEGRQQPTLAIQKFAPDEIQVGKPCKFLVRVRNTGQRPASGVVVQDEVPAGTQLVGTKPQAQAAGGQLVWKLGELAPGEERTLEMELTPMEEGQIGSVAKVSFSAEASAQTTCTRPQLAIRMKAPSKVLVGQQQVIQIEIKNPGSGDATGVVIFENVPENLRHAAGPTLEFEVGTLRAGETRRLQLNMQAESPGKVVNTLTAQADGNLHVDQRVDFEVVAPGLQVAVDGPKKRYLERPADYTVEIGNPGTASARDLRLVTQLPRGMKFVKANNLGEYDASTHAVYWSLAELPAGEHGTVQLTAVPVAAGDHQIEVRAESADGLRDKATLGTQVEGIAALKFSVTDMEDPIEVGGETEYLIRVANQGTKAATNVAVQVAAPAGVQVVSATGDSRHRIQGGIVAFEPLRQLAPGAEVTFRLRVRGTQPGDHRLVVEVGSDDLAQPVRKEESTRVFGDE